MFGITAALSASSCSTTHNKTARHSNCKGSTSGSRVPSSLPSRAHHVKPISMPFSFVPPYIQHTELSQHSRHSFCSSPKGPTAPPAPPRSLRGRTCSPNALFCAKSSASPPTRRRLFATRMLDAFRPKPVTSHKKGLYKTETVCAG